MEKLQEEFFEIKFETRRILTGKEKKNSIFFDKFREYLLDLPVTKKQVHIRFFSRNEDEILKAKTIQKLFVILSRYCNYINYEIIFHIVKKFCPKLKARMVKYRDSLISFEKSTTVNVYLRAISARPGGKISLAFIRMTIKLNKLPSECTLYEIREMKESIEEKASLESYSVYIENPEEGSVLIRLHVSREVGWMVGVVLTADLLLKHLLIDIMITDWCYEKSLVTFMVRNGSVIHFVTSYGF